MCLFVQIVSLTSLNILKNFLKTLDKPPKTCYNRSISRRFYYAEARVFEMEGKKA